MAAVCLYSKMASIRFIRGDLDRLWYECSKEEHDDFIIGTPKPKGCGICSKDLHASLFEVCVTDGKDCVMSFYCCAPLEGKCVAEAMEKAFLRADSAMTALGPEVDTKDLLPIAVSGRAKGCGCFPGADKLVVRLNFTPPGQEITLYSSCVTHAPASSSPALLLRKAPRRSDVIGIDLRTTFNCDGCCKEMFTAGKMPWFYVRLDSVGEKRDDSWIKVCCTVDCAISAGRYMAIYTQIGEEMRLQRESEDANEGPSKKRKVSVV